MIRPLREGFDAATGSGQATLYPPGWDPMIESLNQLKTSNELLARATAALTNVAAQRDVVLTIPPSNGQGLAKAQLGHPRIRGKGLILAPYGSGRFAIKYGTAIIFQSQFAGSAVTVYVPFPFVWQEGNDIELFDPTAIGTLQEYYVYIVGTTE